MAYRGHVDEDLDSYLSARVAAMRFAEFVNVMIGSVTKR